MKKADQDSIRVLHVVGGMNRGGIETWLMHVLRHIDRDRFSMDFLVHTTQPCAYDHEVRILGGKVIPCLYPSQPWVYAHNFKRILREFGPYDVVHSHVHHFSGYVLRLAQQRGVPVRIAHSHLDTSQLDAKAGLLRRCYLRLTTQWIAHYATIRLAASQKAAVALFSQAWNADSRWQVLYCGIDLTPFRDLIDSATVRAELGIPTDAFVVGHVGRFDQQKNHSFLIDIAAEVTKREPKMYLLLVGDGALRSVIEQKVAQLGLTDRVCFAGIRPDAPRIMLGTMDAFLLPSFHEGLPLVLLEAQAARLPCTISDVVTEEVDVVKPLVRRLSLSRPASTWAEVLLTTKKAEPGVTQGEALTLLEQSPLNIQTSVEQLEKLYLESAQNSFKHTP